MHRSTFVALCALLLAPSAFAQDGRRDPATLPAPPKAFGDLTQDLVFKPLTACRIVDTRIVGGPIGADGTRSFLAVAVNGSANFTSQGGSATSCNTTDASASAVLLNVTVIAPTNAGGATVYKAGDPRPQSTSIQYAAGAVQSSQVMTAIPNPLAISDFTIHTQFSAHFTVDVVGLFTRSPATAPECIGTTLASSTIAPNAASFFNAPACPAGYTATTPYCYTDTAGVYSQGSGFNGNNPNQRLFCAWRNTTGVTQTVFSGAVCCRVPGR